MGMGSIFTTNVLIKVTTCRIFLPLPLSRCCGALYREQLLDCILTVISHPVCYHTVTDQQDSDQLLDCFPTVISHPVY